MKCQNCENVQVSSAERNVILEEKKAHEIHVEKRNVSKKSTESILHHAMREYSIFWAQLLSE